MIHRIRSSGGLGRAVMLALLAAVLVLRLMMPSGWMAVRDGGGLRFTLCTGTGPMAMSAADTALLAEAMDDHRGGTRDHTPADGDHACPFAAAALQLVLPVLPPLLAPVAATTASRALPARLVSIGRGLAAPPPPATGPPLSA